jgi:hypothetical protein
MRGPLTLAAQLTVAELYLVVIVKYFVVQN